MIYIYVYNELYGYLLVWMNTQFQLMKDMKGMRIYHDLSIRFLCFPHFCLVQSMNMKHWMFWTEGSFLDMIGEANIGMVVLSWKSL